MLALFTLVHVLISLVGIAAGFVVIYGMLENKRLEGWTKVFLAATVATSVTGFGFPFEKLLPSHLLGVLSLIILGVTIYARYPRAMAGGWRNAHVITVVVAQYFNFLVLVRQVFLKVPALHALAPQEQEPPFVIAQLVTLIAFIVLGVLATRKFRGGALATG